MNQTNQNGTVRQFVNDYQFSNFLSVALSPVKDTSEVLHLAFHSDFRTLTELPPIVFPLDASYEVIEDELSNWKEFFSDRFPVEAIGEYVIDMSENKGGRKYVLYGNDAFLHAYFNHLDEVEISDSKEATANVIFGEYDSVESLLVEIQTGNVEIEYIDLELPAGF
jgi:hypothetical protein